MRLEELDRLGNYEGLRTNRRQLFIAGGMGALLLAGCGGSSDSGTIATDLSGSVAGGGKPVDLVNWGIVADPVGLDPIGPNDYQSVQPMYQAYDTILQLNEKNGISPMIAESWEQKDPTTYIYNIRSGVTFQDGSPMTVEDVAYSIQRHVDPSNGSALADFVASVRSVETNGNNQVIVTLKEPDAMWKYIPCLPVGMVVSQANIEKIVVFAAGAPPKVAAGNTQRTEADRWIARVLATDFTNDPGFNTGKPFWADGDGKNLADDARRGLVEADGSIVSAGYANFTTAGGVSVVLLRLKPDGTPDTTFGFGSTSPGQTKFNPFASVQGASEAYAVVKQSNGRYVTTVSTRSSSTLLRRQVWTSAALATHRTHSVRLVQVSGSGWVRLDAVSVLLQ